MVLASAAGGNTGDVCTDQITITIGEPDDLTALITFQQNVLCFGDATGLANVSVEGGTEEYTYSWNTTPEQTGATAVGLTAGTYTVIITDANGCMTAAGVLITQPDAALTAAITSQEDVLCFADATGSATVTVEGGTEDYTYSWNTTPEQTGATADGLTAGTYIVTVTDANECATTAEVIITQPDAALTAAITSQEDVLCFADATGSATVTVEGGTEDYTYSWNTTPEQTGATADGLTAGTYIVTVTDANECATTAEVIISEPQSSLEVEITSQETELCFGDANGAVDISVSGGTPIYTYLWSTTDGSGLVVDAEDQSGLTAGTYVVQITDTNSCITSQTVIIEGPQSVLIATITDEVDILCFGGATGSATVFVEGGTNGYTYSWNTIPEQTSSTATELIAGTYIVTVTDANGCNTSAEVIISEPNSPLSSTITSQVDVLCYGDDSGEIDLTVNGGTPDYTYLWSTVDGSGLVVDTEDQFGLSGGTYNVLITDINGCTTLNTVTISEPQSELDVLIISQADISCSSLGSVTVEASGGSLPYEYSLNGETAQSNGIFNDLNQGDNNIIVTDLNGCSFFVPVFIENDCIAIFYKEGEWNDENGNGAADVGETISYTFSITNTGEDSIYNLIITDPLPGVIMQGGPITELLPQETDDTTFTAIYNITQEDLDNGEVTNQAIFTGENIEGNEIIAANSDDPSTDDENDSTIVTLPSVAGIFFEIFNGLTPNGDGFNDYFKIDGIDQFPNNNVQIFNRWGILIFEANGYNESSNIFTGESNARANIGGDRNVPTGTYFYVITFSDENPGKNNYSGYLYINR